MCRKAPTTSYPSNSVHTDIDVYSVGAPGVDRVVQEKGGADLGVVEHRQPKAL